MEVLATIAAWFAVGVLVLVVGSVFARGIRALNLDLIIKNPAPFGQTGGGIANAIVGTIILVAVATAMAVPVGFLIGIYISQFAPPGWRPWCASPWTS